jgi:hypothetical protein
MRIVRGICDLQNGGANIDGEGRYIWKFLIGKIEGSILILFVGTNHPRGTQV